MEAHLQDIDTDEAAVRALEARRCELISHGDIKGLSDLLADDYVHVHATGRLDDKAAALVSFEQVPRLCSRGDLDVRIMGDVAVVIGPQINLRPWGTEMAETVLVVTTILRRRGAGWRLVSFHGCRQG